MIVQKSRLEKVLEAFQNLKARAARDIIKAQQAAEKRATEEAARAAEKR